MLIGQQRAETALTAAMRHGRVSHAYLFTGPESVGKNTAALLFAQALNCQRRTDLNTEAPRHEGDFASVSPCLGIEGLAPCDSCRRIAAGTHPDVHVIVPGSKSGQNISVEQMRDVRQDVARRPIMGRHKLYLMPFAEAMNEEAANTLLKTLEEPPEYVTLILMAASPTRVLPTVLSRCCVVPFRLVPAGEIRTWLEANGIAAEAAVGLAFSAAGHPGLAWRWSREPEALARRQQVLELLGETTAFRQRARQNLAEGIAALRLAERARALVGPAEIEVTRSGAQASRRSGSNDKEGPAGGAAATEGPNSRAAEGQLSAKPAFMGLLEQIRGYFRDLLLLAQGAPESLVGNADALGALRAAAAGYSAGDLVAALDAVNRTQQFIERNVAPQLALESLFLELLQPEESTATDAAPRR